MIDDTTQDEFGITISEDGKSITIMEATEENAGDYICEATAALGKVNGTVGTLSVDPPRMLLAVCILDRCLRHRGGEPDQVPEFHTGAYFV